MNIKKLLFLSTILTICLLFNNSGKLLSQSKLDYRPQANNVEDFENIYLHWFFALDKARLTNNIPRQEFDVFSRFYEKKIDSLRVDFMQQITDGKVTTTNVAKQESELTNSIVSLFHKFQTVEKLYPSSVDEYRKYKAPYLTGSCDSACNNINFASGNLSGWNAYYGVNASSTTVNNFALITGGPAGAVTHAADDPLTHTAGYYNAVSVGPNPSPDYQINITSGSRNDAIVPSIPVVSPFGGNYSVMLGDSTEVNYGVAILSQTFMVTPSNENFTYQYAVILANPIHNYYQQPIFKVAVLDGANDTIPYCGEYNVVSGHGTQKFDSMYYTETYPDGNTGTFIVYYKNWTMVNVPLKKYLGQCVTVVFEAVDCALGGHFGYAYIDASCSPLSVLSSSAVFCGQDSIELTGPPGESQYYWTGPAGGITSNDSLQSVYVVDTGIYTCVVTPFTGASCNDTLTIHIGKQAGPPPFPKFTADTVCVGSATAFTNQSNPLAGAHFYWDFYNLGTYEDSTVNPTWKYNQPGLYTVKLHEVYNGCGTDTLIQILVDSAVVPAFTADTVCARDTLYFTNNSTGGTSYRWTFGDPSSGINNTSILTNPWHVYNTPGTYTVTLEGNNPGNCADSIRKTVVVLPNVSIKISGTDSICSGSVAVITASGGKTYLWNTGATTSSIKVHPTSDSTYTVKVSNGRCYLDTSFRLVVKPIGVGTLMGKGSVCMNDSLTLTATGGGTYLWNTGATTSSITVYISSKKDSDYSVIISNADSCLTINKKIYINPVSGFACCDDTIWTGSSTTLTGSNGTTYKWIPPIGLSCDTCPDPIANPTVTTTYTLITTTDSGCTANSFVTVTVEIPCKDFFVPNVFTPPSGGIDATFLIQVEFMSKYEIWIYNRWGKLVFHSQNPDAPWDGNIDGNPASAGTYYYILKATCEAGTDFEKHGFLSLVR